MGSTVFSILRPETPQVVTVSPLGYPALHIYRIRPIHGTAPVSYRSSFDSVATSFSGFFVFKANADQSYVDQRIYRSVTR